MFGRFAGVFCLGVIASSASAEFVEISFENMLPSGGMAFTPVFFGVHDGGFDLFNTGEAASPGLEAVAELGDTSILAAEFAGAPGAGPAGTAGAAPILGGAMASITLDVTDPTSSRFLTFASMVVPSNDLFIGNGNPTGIELFDAGGGFLGPLTIEIFGSQVWDAGTEMNDILDGGAFVDGVDATRGTPEGGVVQLFLDQPGSSDYLDSLLGVTTAAGYDLESTFTDSTLLARITVIPAPGAACAILLAGFTGRGRRRRR